MMLEFDIHNWVHVGLAVFVLSVIVCVSVNWLADRNAKRFVNWIPEEANGEEDDDEIDRRP